MHVIAPPVEWASATAYQSGADKLPFAQQPSLHDIGDPTQQGALTDNLPIDTLAYPYGAQIAANPLHDVYDTIWVVPVELRIGAVTAQTTRNVAVWNAYRTEKLLEEVSATGAEGVEIEGPALPYTFRPLEDITLAVTVLTDGPTNIDARYEFDFPGVPFAPYLRIVGRRVIQWTIPPNWSTPPTETLSYRTEVITAHDGTEQRLALRHRPRRRIGFTALTAHERDRQARRLLGTWQHRSFVMADWMRGVPIEPIAAEATEVVLTDPLPELSVGQMMVLREGERTQAMEVEAIEGTTLTLRTPTSEAFGAGARAYPGLLVHADPSISGRRLTSAIGEMALRFSELHTEGAIEPPPPETTWRGLEVFLRRPNWAMQPGDDHAFDFTWLDTGRGAFDFRTPVDAPSDVRRFKYTLRDRDEVRAMIAFFQRCRGQRGEFYAPTHDDDLPLPEGASLTGGTSSLPVRDIDDADRMAAERVYRNVYIRLTDGTELLRQVIGADLLDAEEPKLGLDTTWPRTIEAHEIAKISWMPRWRLASDDMTITWLTAGIAEVTLAMRVLPDVEAP